MPVNKHKDAQIDAGLNRLLSRQQYGQTFTLYAIARECGCSYQAIQRTEKRALRKLWNRLRLALGETSAEFAKAQHLS